MIELVAFFAGAAVASIVALAVRRKPPDPREISLEQGVQHLQEGLLLVDESGAVRFHNAAASHLLGSEEGGANEVSLEPIEPALAQLSQPSDTTLRQILDVRLGNSTRTLELTGGPVGGGWRFVVLSDLSGLTTFDVRRREFVANASHELQTPIAALVGLLELLEDAEGEHRDHLLRRAQKKADDLATLTRDLMGLARAEDPNWQPVAEPVALRPICESIAERFAEKLEAKGLELELSIEGEPELIADPIGLETILANLVDNAVSYTSEGRVSIEVEPDSAEGLVLTVSDTGEGIDPTALPRIFERFFRGDPARSRESGGSGLGLSIVRNFVGRMGGRIAVQSLPGAGTRFRIELPPDPTRPLEGAGQARFV